MGYGPVQVFTVTIASAATSSDSAAFGKSFSKVFLDIPSGISNVNGFHVQGSSDDSDFKRIASVVGDTSTVAANDFTIASASSNRMLQVPLHAPYGKVEVAAALSNGATFKIICSD